MGRHGRKEAVLNAHETAYLVYVEDLAEGIARRCTPRRCPTTPTTSAAVPYPPSRTSRRRFTQSLTRHAPAPRQSCTPRARAWSSPVPSRTGVRTGVQSRSGSAGLHRRTEPRVTAGCGPPGPSGRSWPPDTLRYCGFPFDRPPRMWGIPWRSSLLCADTWRPLLHSRRGARKQLIRWTVAVACRYHSEFLDPRTDREADQAQQATDACNQPAWETRENVLIRRRQSNDVCAQ